MLSEDGIQSLMQIAVVERKVFADALLKRKPAVLNRIEIGRIRRQKFLSASGSGKELASSGRLVEASIVVDHNLSWFQDGAQTVLHIDFKERGVTGPLEHEGCDQLLLVEGSNQTYALGAMAGFLAPARFALGTPAKRTSFMIIPARLIQIDQLLGGDSGQLRPKLLP